MPKYVAWIPTWATVRYELKTDKDLSGEELQEEFERKAKKVGGKICTHCGKDTDIGEAAWDEWDGTISEE